MKHFTSAEFEQRVSDLQKSLYDFGLDAVVLTTAENFYYYSGFQSDFWQSPTRPWFLIIPKEGERILVIPEIGFSAMQNLNINTIHTWAAPNLKDDGVSLLLSVLNKLSCRFAKIGWEMGRESIIRMPIFDFNLIRSSMHKFQFVDASPLIWSKRMVKSEAEINYIRKSCQIASSSFNEMLQEIQYGDTEKEIERKMIVSLINNGADKVPFISVCSDKQGYNQIISGSRGIALDNESILFLDVGATYRGYFCDFDRNFGFGDVHESVKKAYQIVNSSIEVALKEVRANMTCKQLCEIMIKELEKQSGCKVSNNVGRLGHSIGLQLTEPPSISLEDTTRLKEGMVITLEPGFEFSPKKMIVLEENIVIRAEGCELLSTRLWDDMPIFRP